MGLDSVELILLIEKKLDISFVDSEIEKLSTVRDVSEYAFLLQKSSQKKSLAEAQETVIECINTISGIPKSDIRLDSCIVKDLGID